MHPGPNTNAFAADGDGLDVWTEVALGSVLQLRHGLSRSAPRRRSDNCKPYGLTLPKWTGNSLGHASAVS